MGGDVLASSQGFEHDARVLSGEIIGGKAHVKWREAGSLPEGMQLARQAIGHPEIMDGMGWEFTQLEQEGWHLPRVTNANFIFCEIGGLEVRSEAIGNTSRSASWTRGMLAITGGACSSRLWNLPS